MFQVGKSDISIKNYFHLKHSQNFKCCTGFSVIKDITDPGGNSFGGEMGKEATLQWSEL